MTSSPPPRILSIAGSDSSGGAGIQADLKTIAMLGGYGMSAITAVTAQNTLGVHAVEALDAEFDAIRQAYAVHGVIFFRDQDLTEDDHIAFAERWAPINVNRFFAAHPDYPQIAMVAKEKEQKDNIGGGWHTDHSYDEVPARCSMLYAIETPEAGGDTMFASMCAAFEGLSDGMKDTLRSMKAWHSSRHIFGEVRKTTDTAKTGRIGNSELATQDNLHPAVIRHPLSGRESLYVNPDFTVSFDTWNKEESDALLAYLYKHAVQPEYTCRVRWVPGTLTIWDNLATWHKAINDYAGHRRRMHRITVDGMPLAASRQAA